MTKFLKCTHQIVVFALVVNSIVFPCLQASQAVMVRDLVAKSLPVEVAGEDADNKKKELNTNLPSNNQMYLNALNLYAQANQDLDCVQLDPLFVKKMELCCGDGNVQASLMNAVDNTVTMFGKAALANTLACPTSDYQSLMNNQAIIHALLNNTQLFNKIDAHLHAMKAAEGHLFSYYAPENKVNEELFKLLYWNYVQPLNESSLGLELGVRLDQLLKVVNFISLPATFAATFAMGNYNNNSFKGVPTTKKQAMTQGIKGLFNTNAVGFKDGPAINTQYGPVTASPESVGDFKYFYDQMPPKGRAVMVSYGAVLAGLQIYQTYAAQVDFATKNKLLNFLHGQLIAVADYLRHIKAIGQLISNNPALSQFISSKELQPKLSAKAQELVSLLNSSTFKGNATIFSLSGRILRAHKLMKEVKHELVPLLLAIGKIDMYMSITKLYKAHQGTSARYSFAQYIAGAMTPYISAQGFWNPFIENNKVVVNDVVIGNDMPNNIVLTGPNTGGKSTVIKALMLNILLAQTLSIVPAESFIFTLFNNLNCYLNITDDLNAATSLFAAEVARAKSLIESVRALKPQTFSFTIIDEIFSGTSPKEGEDAAVQFAQQLGNHAQSICCIATHFPRLTEELGTNYKNYQVSVYKNENDTWVRPFKLQEGRSFQNIAMELLKEEGLF